MRAKVRNNVNKEDAPNLESPCPEYLKKNSWKKQANCT